MNIFGPDDYRAFAPPGMCFISSPSGGGGGQPQTTTTTQTNEPYAEQKLVLDPLLQQIKPVVFDDKREFFPGSTVVPFSPETQLGLGQQANRAAFGDPNLGLAGQEIGKTLSGDYLNIGNPSFQRMSNRIYGDIRQQTDSQFGGAGRYGSPGHQEATARAFGDAIAPLEYGNYQAERERMGSAIDRSIPLANQPYIDAGFLRDVGAQREGLSGQELSEQIQRHNFGQTSEAQQLAEAIGLAGTFNAGGTSNATTTGPAPVTGSNFGQTAGLGLQAASLFIPKPKPTIICTECHAQGLFPDELMEFDKKFALKLYINDWHVLAGYYLWAKPVVELMKKSRTFAHVVSWIARPIAEQMALEMGRNGLPTGVGDR